MYLPKHSTVRLKRRHRHVEPSIKPIVATAVLLGAAFVLMVLVWRFGLAAR